MGMQACLSMRNESMKNFLSPVARVCAEIVEMTGNIGQGARRRGSALADKASDKDMQISTNNRANYLPRRPSELQQPPVSEACAIAAVVGIEHRERLEFDVGRFCSELEEWRVAMAPKPIASGAIGYRRSAKHDPLVLNSHPSIVPYEVGNASTSLESNVADAVRWLEDGFIFGPLERVSRGG